MLYRIRLLSNNALYTLEKSHFRIYKFYCYLDILCVLVPYEVKGI